MTGGEDDKAYVWRVSDGEVLLECTGNIRVPNDFLSRHKMSIKMSILFLIFSLN